MQKLRNIGHRPNYKIVFLLILFLLLMWYSQSQKMLHGYQECTEKYPIKKIYLQLSKTHYWRIYSKPFMEIESYIDNRKDGISLYYGNLDDRSKNIFMGVSQIHFDKRDGITLDYINEKLYHISFYNNGVRNGVDFTMRYGFPSLVIVYKNNQNMGLVSFKEKGEINEIKFGSNYKDETREGGENSTTYDNGQKAFEYVVDRGVQYWVVYDPQGKMLVKYPLDNDFCKAEFYDNGKKVEIPNYFDRNEFEEVYKKIKNDTK